MKKLLIVESPAKAKTIEKYLGHGFSVKSSIGHIRQIPSKGKDVIDIKNDFKTTYEVDPEKKKTVAELLKATKSADEVYLATDPDREGEAIAWHLAEVLGLKLGKTKRVTYQEITKDAITEAINNPRTIDMDLVSAQQARQILDRIVGYELSPVVWRKVPGGKSAGRVQSPALRLIVEREREIESFCGESTFKVTAVFSKGNDTLEGKLNIDFPDEKTARKFLESIINAKYIISDINSSEGSKNPSAPFTTSTLQQEASAKFGYSAKTTMTAAQKLYQSGKITYMRTDSFNISNQALGQIGNFIEKKYGKEYLKIRKFATKNASAQEAHEAIRPTDISLERASSNAYDQKLYDLIRRRTLASQMSSARIEKTTVTISIEGSTMKGSNLGLAASSAALNGVRRDAVCFEAKGEVVLFDGFLRVYGNGKETVLPQLSVGDNLNADSIVARQTFAKPPARYSEGSLVKKLESLGIGRPSTYATIMEGIQTRGYVRKGDSEGQDVEIIELTLDPITTRKRGGEGLNNNIQRNIVIGKTGADKGKLIPTDIGKVLSDFLVNYFMKVVDYDWTAEIEGKLDQIADGKLERVKMLNCFYKPFHAEINKSDDIDRKKVAGARKLGKDPKTGEPIFARLGRFGPMLQLGEGKDSDKKPRFMPLPDGKTLDDITLEDAIKQLDLPALPRTLGTAPDGTEIIASNGPFGPYIKGGDYSVPIKDKDPYTITLKSAVELYEAKKASIIHDWGEIKVVIGAYGPYVKGPGRWNNAKIPKGTDPKKLTEAEAKKLLAEAPKKKQRFPRKKK